MIVYKLKCSDGHTFEAWFQNSVAFETQKQRALLSCPFCPSLEISKAPMSPRLSFNQNEAALVRQDGNDNTEYIIEAPAISYSAPNFGQQEQTGAIKVSGGSIKTGLGISNLEIFTTEKSAQPNDLHPAPLVRQLLMNLKNVVKMHCDDVGARFAEEARRIHYGETKLRNIYGQASFEEMIELHQEGIDVSALPPFPREDA